LILAANIRATTPKPQQRTHAGSLAVIDWARPGTEGLPVRVQVGSLPNPDSIFEIYYCRVRKETILRMQRNRRHDAAMKAPILMFASMSLGLVPVMSDHAQLERGSVVVARDQTGSVLGTDSTQSLDQLMEFVRNQDQGAVKRLTREGHLFRIKSGSSVEILGFDSGEHAYKVRVIGSNKEIWLVKETVFNK
jgi:hypothetical protein